MKVSACICVRNQREHMTELLKLLVGRVDEIVIVDGMSTDGTFDACLQFPVRIISRYGRGPDADREYCVNMASHNWVLVLDADERPVSKLLEHLHDLTLSLNSGFWIPRRNYYAPGRYYQHIHYPDYQLRLFNRTKATVSNKVHGTPTIDGKVVKLPGDYYLEHLQPIYNDRGKYRAYALQQAKEWSLRWPRPLYPLIAVYQAVKDFLNALSGGCLLDGIPGLKAAVDRAMYTGTVYYYMTFKE